MHAAKTAEKWEVGWAISHQLPIGFPTNTMENLPPLGMPEYWHASCAAGTMPIVPNMQDSTDEKHDRKTN
jgi:hypothetical protein